MICPHCLDNLTIHETISGEKNYRTGDVAICINCGEWNQFLKKKLIKLDMLKIPFETLEEMRQIEDSWVRTKKLRELTNR